MSIEEIVRKSAEAFNRHDPTAFAATYATEAAVTDPQYAEALKGREAIKRDIEYFFRSFPDIRWDPQTVVGNGKTYAVEGSMTGTHKGPLVGPGGEIPPTNKRATIGVALFGRLGPDDQIVEERRYFDMAGLMAQLGLMPDA